MTPEVGRPRSPSAPPATMTIVVFRDVPATTPDPFGTTLLRLARRALDERILGRPPGAEADRSEPRLLEARGCFVSLRDRAGRLRGCLGRIEPTTPLIDAVPELAVAAATRDPRFSPVTAGEVAALILEVSVLTTPRPLEIAPLEEILPRLSPRVDGVVLSRRDRSATFLPQVWEQLPAPEVFLRELRRKAGLPPDLWDDEIRLSTYRVESWCETPPAGIR